LRRQPESALKSRQHCPRNWQVSTHGGTLLELLRYNISCLAHNINTKTLALARFSRHFCRKITASRAIYVFHNDAHRSTNHSRATLDC
jgi:hypothetical protein